MTDADDKRGRRVSIRWPTESKPRRWQSRNSEAARQLQAEIAGMRLSGPSVLTEAERAEARESIMGRCRWLRL